MLDVCIGGEGLMRSGDLTHTESIIAAFEKNEIKCANIKDETSYCS